MLYKDDDKIWGTEYTVDDIKVLLCCGAVPKDFIEILPNGAIQISAFVIVTMKVFTKAEFGEDWVKTLRHYLHHAARDPNLNGKIKRALASVLSKRATHEAEIRETKRVGEKDRELILKTLEQNDGNRTRTASALGITRGQLQHRLKKYDIDPDQFAE